MWANNNPAIKGHQADKLIERNVAKRYIDPANK
jgi:hypothetical protein